MALNSDWNDVMRSWRPPSEIAGTGPREVRLNGRGKSLVGAMLLLLAGGLVMSVFLSRKTAREAAERSALEASNVESQATVTRHWRADDKSETPMIAYRFEYDGRIYHGTSSAPLAEWKDLDVGSSVTVRLVASNPLISHPTAWARSDLPVWMAWFTLAMFATPPVAAFLMLQRSKRLLRDGRAAPARVTGHRRGKGDTKLIYEYPLPGGGVGKGRGGQTGLPTAIGSIITVLYDQENPKRSSPYPMTHIRLER
jgi:hypothetical protein